MKIVYLFTAFLPLSASSFAADSVTFTTQEDGSVTALNAQKAALWHRYNGSAGDAAAEGAMPLAAHPASATMPTWDPLTTLDPFLGSHLVGPIFDSLGNAWVVINDDVNLMAIQSNGTSGTWKAPHIISPAIFDQNTIGLAVDRNGGFYVVYQNSLSNVAPYPLAVAKYSSSSGWSAPFVAYNSPTGWSETFPLIDSAGRLVTMFNSNGISSVVCNTTTLACGNPQVISPASASPILPSVASNSSGTRLVLLYLLSRQGLRYCFFNSATGQWDTPIAVPDSDDVTFSFYGSLNAFPLTVDEAGNVTTLEAIILFPGVYSAAGFRYEAGAWTKKRLLRPSRSTLVVEFAGKAVNSAGEVLFSAPAYAGYDVNTIDVFRYRPGKGWTTEIAGSYASNSEYRCTASFFLSGEAVVVYGDVSIDGVEKAALYANGAWGPGPAIPGGYRTQFPSSATAPTGEVLLGMESDVYGRIGVTATWLRP